MGEHFWNQTSYPVVGWLVSSPTLRHGRVEIVREVREPNSLLGSAESYLLIRRTPDGELIVSTLGGCSPLSDWL